MRPARIVPCFGLVLAAALLSAAPLQAEETAASALPAALRAEGVPTIPAPLVDRLRAYQSTRRAASRGFTDDGRTLLISTRFGDLWQLHRVDSPGGARTQVTFRDETVSGGEWVPGDPDSLIFRSDLGGNEQYQILRHDLKSGRSTLLSDGRARHGSPLQRPDGGAIVYSSTARNGRDFDLWTGDGRSPDTAKLLVEVEGAWSPSDWSADGSSILAGRYVSRTESHVYRVDAKTGEVEGITGKRDKHHHGDARFGADPDTLWITSDRGGEFTQLYEVRRKGKRWTWTPRTADLPWDVTEVAVSPDGGTIAFILNEGGFGTLYALDAKTGAHRKLDGLPDGIVYGIDFARDQPVLSLTLAGPSRNGDVWSYDLGAGEATQWTFSETGGLDSGSFIEPELVEVESFDGQSFPSWVYRPQGEGPFPVVVKIHGGPEGQARPWMDPTTQYLLKESRIAVLVPNVRGSSGYGKTRLKMDNGFLREDSVKDIGALLDWVGTQPDLDAERVAVTGGSYGGYMVLAALVHYPDRLKAGIDVVGISSFVTFLENTKEYRRDLRRVEYGDERDKKMRAFLEEISPLGQAEKIDSALFVVHGANDPRVPVGEAEQIAAAVRAKGRDVWTLIAENEGHGFRRKENRDVYTQLSILFLEKHLLTPAD